MIIENREGDLLLRHIGGKIANYHGSNAILEKDHAFQAIRLLIIVRLAMIPNVRFSRGTWFGDFRCPSLKIQHDNNELTQFKLKDSHILHGVVETTGLPSPHSTRKRRDIVFVLEDEFAKLRLTLYYTAYADCTSISTFAKISNLSDKAVVINRALSTMLDVPAGNYDVITLQGAYARGKHFVVKKLSKVSLASLRIAELLVTLKTPAMILCDGTATEDAERPRL